MASERSFLGTLKASRHDSSPILPRDAKGAVAHTEETARSKERRGPSLWHLADVEARAFAAVDDDGRKVCGFRSKMSIFLTLFVYERRTHSSGQAVCLLRLRRTRFCAVVVAAVVLILAAAVISPYAGVALAAAIIVLLAPGAVRAGRALGAETRLRRLSPPGRHVYLHSLASTLPGAGAELLRQLALEADIKRWSLLLDASNEKLSKYYQNFGFLTLGHAVPMPDGSAHRRMWRPAPAVKKDGDEKGTQDACQ